MWEPIKHPGNWLVYLNRQDNKGLPLMEVRKKYLQEQLLFEEYNSYLLTLNTVSPFAAGAAAAAGGGPDPSGGRIPGSEKYIFHSNNVNSLGTYNDAGLPYVSFTTSGVGSNYVLSTTYDSGWTIGNVPFATSTIDNPPWNATWQDLFGNVGQPLSRITVGGQDDCIGVVLPSGTSVDDYIPYLASWRFQVWRNMGDIIDSIVPGLGTSTSRTRSLYWSVDYYTSISNIDDIITGGHYGYNTNVGPYINMWSPGNNRGSSRYGKTPVYGGTPYPDWGPGIGTATHYSSLVDRYGVWNSTPVHKIADNKSLNDTTRYFGWAGVSTDNPLDPTKPNWWRPGDVVFAFKNLRIGYLEAFTDNENITKADIFDDVTSAYQGRAIKHI